MRWARGSTTLLTNGHFWVSKLTLMQKICYLCGMCSPSPPVLSIPRPELLMDSKTEKADESQPPGFFYYSAVSLGIFISPIPGILLLWVRPEWFKYYNLAFAIPSLVYGLLVFRFWAKASYGMNVQHIMLIQSYAYLTAIKDRLFGIELLWAASGDAKAHKSHKYRNMRLLCWGWTIIVTGGMVSAVVYRLLNGMHWYDPIPLIVLNAYNLYVSHRFMLCNW